MNQRQIFRLIERYARTGVIADALLPFYDQSGKWRGDTIPWKRPVPNWIMDKMRRSYLPPSRRTTGSRFGTVLKTSFHWAGDAPAWIKYGGIDGSLIATGSPTIHAPALRDIGGNLISTTTNRINLPCLATVGGQVELLNSFLLRAPRLRHVGHNLMIAGNDLPSIESVGGRLGIYWAFSFEPSKLRRVGGCLVLSKAEVVSVAALESVGGSILLGSLARTINAPALETVGGDFLAGSVAEIRVPRLRLVAGDMATQSAKGFYHSRIKVGGEWSAYPGAREEWEAREVVRLVLRGDGPPMYL